LFLISFKEEEILKDIEEEVVEPGLPEGFPRERFNLDSCSALFLS